MQKIVEITVTVTKIGCFAPFGTGCIVTPFEYKTVLK